nr:unnamed protein product [Digitaria exilis]
MSSPGLPACRCWTLPRAAWRISRVAAGSVPARRLAHLTRRCWPTSCGSRRRSGTAGPVTRALDRRRLESSQSQDTSRSSRFRTLAGATSPSPLAALPRARGSCSQSPVGRVGGLALPPASTNAEGRLGLLVVACPLSSAFRTPRLNHLPPPFSSPRSTSSSSVASNASAYPSHLDVAPVVRGFAHRRSSIASPHRRPRLRNAASPMSSASAARMSSPSSSASNAAVPIVRGATPGTSAAPLSWQDWDK